MRAPAANSCAKNGMTEQTNPPLTIESPDEYSRVVYLEVPGAKVVLLQAYFELYEGLGVVRTLDIRTSLVCIVTTASQLDECLRALEALRPEIGWRTVPLPSEAERERYLGYFSNAPDNSKV
jgi:hypothetical protein